MIHFINVFAGVTILSLFTLGCGAAMSGGPLDGGSAKFSRNSDTESSDANANRENGQLGDANNNDTIDVGDGNNSGINSGNGSNGDVIGGNNGSNGNNGSIGGDGGSKDCKWLRAEHAGILNVVTASGQTYTPSISFMAHDPYKYGANAYKADMYLVKTNSGWEDDRGQKGSQQIIAQLELTNANSANCQLAVTNASAPQRNGGGCFHSRTKIKLADGRDMPIAFLQVDDKVWNPITKKAVAIKRIIAGPEKPGFYEVSSNGRQVRVTEKHPFETKEGLRTADQLTSESYILGEDGRFHRIDSVKQLDSQPGAYAWNLELEGSISDHRQHMVLADGVVTGDLFLQEKIAGNEAPIALSFLDEKLSLNTNIGVNF